MVKVVLTDAVDCAATEAPLVTVDLLWGLTMSWIAVAVVDPPDVAEAIRAIGMGIMPVLRESSRRSSPRHTWWPSPNLRGQYPSP